MRKYLFVIALLIPFSLIAQVREHWLPDNSILSTNWVSGIFKDSKDRIWVCNDTLLLMRDENGWHCDMHDTIKEYMITKKFLLKDYTLSAPIEDNYGNVFFFGSFGFAMYNNKNQWVYYSYDIPDYSWIQLSYSFVPAPNGKIYLPSQLGMWYMTYNTDSCKYEFNPNIISKRPKEIEGLSVSVPILSDSLIIMHNVTQDITYNIYTDKWTCGISNRVPIPEFPNYNKAALINESINKDSVTYFLSGLIPGQLEMRVINRNGDIRTYSCQVDTAYPESDFQFISSLFIDEAQETIMFHYNLRIYIFSEELGFIQIPEPIDNGYFPDSTMWIINSWCLVQENELWLGIFTNGLVICDVKELIASGEILSTTTSVEINPHLPMMNIYRVYPQPNSSYVNFEYYMQSGLFSDIKVSVYDSFGKELKHIKYENIIKESIISTLRLNTTQFSAGVYIIVLDDGTNKASTKFIVEK